MDYIREEAKEEEAQKYSSLIIHLTEEGKTDLIIQAATNNAFREKLYKEYHL